MARVLWRISNYADLNGLGGLLVDGRWHRKGKPVVYLSETPALALLETMANSEIDVEDLPESYQLLKVAIDDSVEPAIVPKLDQGWQQNRRQTQQIGMNFLSQNRLLLAVPSAILPESTNYLFNPLAPQRDLVEIVDVIQFPFDQRLVS